MTKSPRQKKPPLEIKQLTATLQLDKRNRMLYVPLQFRDYENQGLLDTGAIQSAMSEDKLRRKATAHPAALLEEYPAPEFKVQIGMEVLYQFESKYYFDSSLEGRILRKDL